MKYAVLANGLLLSCALVTAWSGISSPPSSMCGGLLCSGQDFESVTV